jgi:hypothetical protein
MKPATRNRTAAASRAKRAREKTGAAGGFEIVDDLLG